MKEKAPAPEDFTAVVSANNRFALDLYAEIRGEQGNLFFSPASIATALAMTHAGARASTESEMAKVLHFDLPAERLHPSFAALNRNLNETGKPYELRVANRLWGQKDYGFLSSFLQVTREHFGAELAEVDFVRASQAARREINAWVEDQTNDKIRDLVPEGALNDTTRLVLTNAIYFLGTWEEQFNKDVTRDEPFRLDAEQTVEVPMMYQKGEFDYGAANGVQLLGLPYEGADLSMLVLLPKEVDGLGALERELTTERLKEWTSDLREQKVHVSLPKFKTTSEFELKKALSSLGMPSAFDPERADFSGISANEKLFISAAIHKAFVDVNEEGTEAAAATGIVVGTTSFQPIPTFRADHPFIFLIRDNRSDAILFLGRMVDPSS